MFPALLSRGLPSWSEDGEAAPHSSWESVKALQEYLTGRQDSFEKKLGRGEEVRAFLLRKKEEGQALHELFEACTHWALRNDLERGSELFLRMVPLGSLLAAIRSRGVEVSRPRALAEPLAPLYPNPDEASPSRGGGAEWREYRSGLLHFIPNLIDLAFEALDSLDPRKKLTSPWDKHLLLQILAQSLLIPSGLAFFLRPLFATALKTYLAAILLLASAAALIGGYRRWLRPRPNDVVCCNRLDGGRGGPKIGQSASLRRLEANLLMHKPVVLVGGPGTGKSTLVQHFVQTSREGSPPEALRDMSTFEVDGGRVADTYGYRPSEILEKIQEQTQGHPRVLLFFEEFRQIASNRAAFQDVKKRVLDAPEGADFVAAMTTEEYVEVREQYDRGGAFWRRITPIPIPPLSDAQVEQILRARFKQEAEEWMEADSSALSKLLKLSKKEDALPPVGRLAKALKWLTEAIGECRMTYEGKDESDGLVQAREEYALLRLRIEGKATEEQLKKAKTCQEQIAELERAEQKHAAEVAELKALLAARQKMRAEYYRLTHRIASSEEETLDEESQIRYLWYHFYALDAFSSLISEKAQSVDAERGPWQVDGALIQRIYDRALRVHEEIHGRPPNRTRRFSFP